MAGESRKRWVALTGISILSFVVFIDFTIVNTILPGIQQELHASVDELQWVINAFFLMLTVFMVMMGRLGDIYARRRMLYIGVIVFALASFLAGTANDPQFLIACRFAQGIAGAIVLTCAVGLVNHHFPEDEQGRALAVFMSVTGFGMALGPVLGGLFLSTLSWSSDGSTFTWTSGASVVTFVQSAGDATVWLASSAQQILPGAGDKPSPGLQVSWDSQGRLASIADQSSIDSTGQPTRVAHFYYGGVSSSLCAGAPAGLLCAFENLDGSRALVHYLPLSTSFGAYQIREVDLPGGATWSFDWQSADYTLTNNTTVTAPQLLGVQTPSGHDAASAGTVTTANSTWWVVYDPFFGELQGIVSPLPGTGPAANDRLGHYYTLASGANPGQARIAWATVSGGADSFSLSPGAELKSVGFDNAWRRTRVETFLDANTSYTVTYGWDAGLDRQTSTTFAGVTQTQGYDFLGRPSTQSGPGAALSTTTYDQGNLAGWTATIYDNATFNAPGVTSEAVNSAAVDWTSAPAGIGSTWSMQLSTYLKAPAAGDSVVYRLTSDSDGSATLWVNGQCDPPGTLVPGPPRQAGGPEHTGKPASPGRPDHTGPPDHAGRPAHAGPRGGASDGCPSDNTATTSAATATGDALNLVVQYVRSNAVSAGDPVSIRIEQQVNGGNWQAIALSDLDPGLDLQSTVASTDTLSPGGSAVTLTRTTAWQDALFRTQAGVTYPGFSGDLIATPGYEADYDPTNSQWKRLTSQTSAGGSTSGVGYWDNTAKAPTKAACSNIAGVIQAGQVQTLSYPESGSGAAGGIKRQLAYDAAGHKAGVEVIPAGESSG